MCLSPPRPQAFTPAFVATFFFNTVRNKLQSGAWERDYLSPTFTITELALQYDANRRSNACLLERNLRSCSLTMRNSAERLVCLSLHVTLT